MSKNNGLEVLHLSLGEALYDALATENKKKVPSFCEVNVLKEFYPDALEKRYNAVCFKRGLTNIKILFELEEIVPGKYTFTLKLGKKLE